MSHWNRRNRRRWMGLAQRKAADGEKVELLQINCWLVNLLWIIYKRLFPMFWMDPVRPRRAAGWAHGGMEIGYAEKRDSKGQNMTFLFRNVHFIVRQEVKFFPMVPAAHLHDAFHWCQHAHRSGRGNGHFSIFFLILSLGFRQMTRWNGFPKWRCQRKKK